MKTLEIETLIKQSITGTAIKKQAAAICSGSNNIKTIKIQR